MENENAEKSSVAEIVKWFVLCPTREAAIDYIHEHLDALKTDGARDEFKKLLENANLAVDWTKQIGHFIEILDQLKTVDAAAAVTAGMRKFTELIALDKSKKFNDTGIE